MNLKTVVNKNIIIWYYVEIKPTLTKYRNRTDRLIEPFVSKFQRWCYLHNIPSTKDFTQWFYGTYKSDNDTYVYHQGVIRLQFPLRIKRGETVITKYGPGIIKSIIIDEDEIIQSVEVSMLSYNFRRSRGYSKYLNQNDLSQLQVYHKPSNQYVLLTPRDYAYIINENQDIWYRVTNRKYATLQPNYKANIEYIKIFNNERGGPEILRKLLKKGYVISKK